MKPKSATKLTIISVGSFDAAEELRKVGGPVPEPHLGAQDGDQKLDRVQEVIPESRQSLVRAVP